MITSKSQGLYDKIMLKILKGRKFLNLTNLYFKDQELEKAYIKS